MECEAICEGAPVSANAQTEANETGGPCPGKYGPPTTKGDFMEFADNREAADAAAAPDGAPAPGASAAEALRLSVRKVLLSSGMTQDAMARAAGVSGATLSLWLAGKYAGNNGAFEERVVAWLAEHSGPALDRCEVAPVWVRTPTGDAIEHVFEYARARPTIGLVYGGSGVGKTTAIIRYARSGRRVWVFEAAKHAASMLEMLRGVEEAMSGYRCEEKRSSTIARGILERLQWAPGGLLIVDEAQHLTLDAVEELRYLHDNSRTGLVFAGNEKVHSQLTGEARRAEFAQLSSRVGKSLRLNRPTPGDEEAIADAWRINGAEARELCQQIAKEVGGLRDLNNALVDATAAAHAMGRAVDAKTLRAAWSDLGGLK